MFGTDGLLQQLTKSPLNTLWLLNSLITSATANCLAKGTTPATSAMALIRRPSREIAAKSKLICPRDRNGEFQPQIIKKGKARFDDLDDKIISMYSWGMTTCDIQPHLK